MTVYRFEEFELDAERFELRRGGQVVAVAPKVFDFIHVLVKSGGVVVTRAELFEKVWPDVVVTPDAMAQVVMAARDALGDDKKEPRFIQTVRSRGYRFIAPVDRTGGAQHDARTPLVGRSAAMSAIEACVSRAREGSGGVVLIVAKRGLGRTRLLDEACSLAESRGSNVARVESMAGAPATWPLSQLLRRIAATGLELAPEVAAIARGEAGSELGTAAARFRLLDRVADALVAAASRASLVVAIDDLDLTDEPTRDLMSLVAGRVRSAPLAIVAGCRRAATGASDAALEQALGALGRSSAVRIVELSALSRGDVAELLTHVLGRAPGDRLLDRVLEKTQGSPSFLAELLPVLRAEERVEREHVSTSAMIGGASMRAAIARHLEALSARAARTVTVASVFGRVFPVAPLAAAVGATTSELLEELHGAELAELVVGHGVGRYRFTYPLVRDVLYGKVPAPELARTHARVASALIAHHGETDDHEVAGEIARHFALAAPTDGADPAADWGLRAATLARNAGDDAAALAYAQQALLAFRFAERPDQERRERLSALVADLGGGDRSSTGAREGVRR